MSVLRDQIAETVARWALMYPLANWPPFGNLATADGRKNLDAIATKLAEAWGSDIAERALAVVQPALDAKDTEIERLKAALHCADAKAALREAVREDVANDMETLTAERDEAEGRAERAEDAIARARAIPRQPHASEQTGELGRAYTRGWESAVAALNAALNEPARQQQGDAG